MTEPSKKKGRLLIQLDSNEEQKTLDNILDNIAMKLGTKCTRCEALWYLVENADLSLLETQGHSGASGVMHVYTMYV